MNWSGPLLWLLAGLAIAILTWELAALRHSRDRWPTITTVVVHWSRTALWKKVVILLFLGWLFAHFYVRLF